MSILSDSISSVGAAIQIADKLKNVELRKLLVSAEEEMLEAKKQLLDSREMIQNLEQKLSTMEDYKLELGVYWRNEDEALLQPFCPACKSKFIIVPLQADRHGTHDTYFRCPACKVVANPFDHDRDFGTVVEASPFLSF